LKGKTYEVRTFGNEVIFYLVSDDDMRVPMQHAVSVLVQSLNGRVRTHGRSMFYRTAFSKPLGEYQVAVDQKTRRILSVSAQSAPLRDLLKDLKGKLGTFSYLIPGDCGDKAVDWSFGETVAEPKTLDSAMSELATVLNLKVDKRNGTYYIFSGDCS